MRLIRSALTALCLCLLVSACGGSSAAPSHTAATHAPNTQAAPAPVQSGHARVAIENFMYMPMHLVVSAGTKLTFHNYDQTAHTATAINSSFDTGPIQPGHSATIVLTKPGTYSYHCLFHAFMVATIEVVPAKKG